MSRGFNAVMIQSGRRRWNLISPDDGPISGCLAFIIRGEDLNFPADRFVYNTFSLQDIIIARTVLCSGNVGFDLPMGFELELGPLFGAHHRKCRISHRVRIPLYPGSRILNTSGKVTLNWEVDDNNFLYAFAATGFKPGGLSVPFNFLGFPPAFEENSQVVRNRMESQGSGDGRLRTQIDAFGQSTTTFKSPFAIPVFADVLHVTAECPENHGR